jgi:tRNA dimethylallyltransferase
MRRPAILLMGPTGAGKTDLAAELVASLPFEIVSVDAAMVYRGMDIGTAKPGPELLARAPHHLIDLADPAESYSAARFLADAGGAVRDIAARGKTPLFAGGTMLYFRALQSGLARLPAADAKIRRGLEERAATEGWPALHAELTRRDPAAAARIRPNDRQRIQRALEVIELSGRPVSSQLSEDLRRATHAGDLKIVLAPADRDRHARHLAQRFEDMMRRGLLEEVRTLHQRPDLNATLPAMRLIGYRQLWRHLEGETTLESAVADAIVATRQLARRQLTWLRAEPETLWFDPQEAGIRETVAARVEAWLASR